MYSVFAKTLSSTLFLLILALSGCGGTMQGVIRGSGQPVEFSYEQGMSSDSYTAVIDGEVFRGRAVMQGGGTVMGNSFANVYSGAASAFGSLYTMGSSYTGSFVATMLGTRGSTLSCQMQYADQTGFTTSGGIGICRHSDGRIIDVVW